MITSRNRGPECLQATGVREVAPGVFELIAQTGRDPVTGKYQQVFRRFRGTLQEEKSARGGAGDGGEAGLACGDDGDGGRVV
jgi:hypothetical protein